MGCWYIWSRPKVQESKSPRVQRSKGPRERRGRIPHMPSTTVHRIYNFSAGPAVLPLPVLEEAQRDLVALPGVGMSMLEISHRSDVFDRILERAVADVRE